MAALEMQHLKPSRDADLSPPEIGGYFELELPRRGDPFSEYPLKYQSGRAALRAALEASAFEQVWAPAYVCDAVVRAVTDAGLGVKFFHLDADLYPALATATLPSNTALLYVNYFGLCDANIDRLLGAFSPDQLLIDNTQALFARPTRARASIYSPRKFVGSPDGGLLWTRASELTEPTQEDPGSLERMAPLLIRASEEASAGYPAFLEASRSLEDTRPLAMSRLTRRVLQSIDFEGVAASRRRNFELLSKRLGSFNQRSWMLGSEAVPLCYPLVLGRDVTDLRKRLAAHRIYVPTYWEDARPRLQPAPGPEQALLDRCLALPCDQRCNEVHIARILDVLESELK